MEYIAQTLNARDAKKMREGFYIKVVNSVRCQPVESIGALGKELAIKWKKKAEDVEKLSYSRFADTLRCIARSYENHAQKIIEEYETKA